ncbi:hypothetical protein F5B18DRAFT_634587 [Nemania serpens]|nr:hypothetical protein F5B18DRAFT_634587 [Nemania serpens]
MVFDLIRETVPGVSRVEASGYRVSLAGLFQETIPPLRRIDVLTTCHVKQLRSNVDQASPDTNLASKNFTEAIRPIERVHIDQTHPSERRNESSSK